MGNRCCRYYGEACDGAEITVRLDSRGYYWKTSIQSRSARFTGPYRTKAGAFRAARLFVTTGFCGQQPRETSGD